jgi:hypothetical protein
MVASFCESREKLQKIWGKIENVGAPTFLGRGYPPVFAYVGERKGLWAGCEYVGETLDFPPSQKSIASAGSGRGMGEDGLGFRGGFGWWGWGGGLGRMLGRIFDGY